MVAKRKPSLRSASAIGIRDGQRRRPLVERHIPEIRSDIKWKFAPGGPATIDPTAKIMICWTFGVPFDRMQEFHVWLGANEHRIVLRLTQLQAPGQANATNVSYRGTYFNIDCGAPMYRTYWAFESEAAAEAGLDPVLTDPTLHGLVSEIRAHWGRDPGRTEHRFGMACLYTQFTSPPTDPQPHQLLRGIPAQT